MATKICLNAGCIASLALGHRSPFILVHNTPQPVRANPTNFVRWYAKKGGRSDCRLAKTDLPPQADLDCPVPCEPQKKKRLGVLHWLKLKVIEGGTNFGS